MLSSLEQRSDAELARAEVRFDQPVPAIVVERAPGRLLGPIRNSWSRRRWSHPFEPWSAPETRLFVFLVLFGGRLTTTRTQRSGPVPMTSHDPQRPWENSCAYGWIPLGAEPSTDNLERSRMVDAHVGRHALVAEQPLSLLRRPHRNSRSEEHTS